MEFGSVLSTQKIGKMMEDPVPVLAAYETECLTECEIFKARVILHSVFSAVSKGLVYNGELKTAESLHLDEQLNSGSPKLSP